jgi:peptidoglycan L-alanyl-D-glutamate endopeptidase CwlK
MNGNGFHWGHRSLSKRAELHDDLVRLVDRTLELSPFDVSITDAYRGEAEQDRNFLSGASQVSYPNSRHNKQPSEAVHLDPAPLDYEQPLKYYVLCGVVWVAAKQLALVSRIRWGGDWDKDFNHEEETFRDLAHWELYSQEPRGE